MGKTVGEVKSWEPPQAAGIHLAWPDADQHECTRACHVYGLQHDRRAFATMNAGELTPELVQSLMPLMRSRSYQTTMKYINMSRQATRAALSLYVPPVGAEGKKKADTGGKNVGSAG